MGKIGIPVKGSGEEPLEGQHCIIQQNEMQNRDALSPGRQLCVIRLPCQWEVDSGGIHTQLQVYKGANFSGKCVHRKPRQEGRQMQHCLPPSLSFVFCALIFSKINTHHLAIVRILSIFFYVYIIEFFCLKIIWHCNKSNSKQCFLFASLC